MLVEDVEEGFQGLAQGGAQQAGRRDTAVVTGFEAADEAEILLRIAHHLPYVDLGRGLCELDTATIAACRCHEPAQRQHVGDLHEVIAGYPVSVGNLLNGDQAIIPDADVAPLREAGVAAVYTPKDFDLNRIMRDIVALVAERHGAAASA